MVMTVFISNFSWLLLFWLKVTGTASILAALICVSLSRAAAIKCLSCTESARPRDCEYVQECGSHEKCSIESYITTTGFIRYDVGCMDSHKCAAVGRKRAILNATVLEEIQQNNYFGTVSDELWDHKDMLVCVECCDTELCNVKGCGEEGLPPGSGPVCYGCDQERNPDSCNKIKLCDRDYACHLSTTRIGVDLVYNSGCIHTHNCNQQAAYEIVGRRVVQMTGRPKRALFCNKCCSGSLCNSGSCSSLTHPPTTYPLTTTLAPVDGEWNTWSHWSLCSVTCGGGQHYRDRFCNNPAPANGGAVCSGQNRETQSCSDQLCTVDGEWNTWSHWNLCSVTCGGGQHYRVRFCNNPAPANGGVMCSGQNRETQSCNDQLCTVLVDGQWSLWTTWSTCSQTCGVGGIKTRQCNCNNPTPSFNGMYCVGQPSEIHQCSGSNDQQVFQGAQNITEPNGTRVVIPCLVFGGNPLVQVPKIKWTAPQTVVHISPSNVAQLRDGSLYIDGLRVENIGPYSCTLTTDCGTYDSPTFWVNIQ